MDKKQPIQLTEQDLHVLVEDAVRTYLIQEGFFSNMWNGAKNVAGGAWDAAKAVGSCSRRLRPSSRMLKEICRALRTECSQTLVGSNNSSHNKSNNNSNHIQWEEVWEMQHVITLEIWDNNKKTLIINHQRSNHNDGYSFFVL